MIVRFEDVITRVTGNVDRYNTDLEYYVGGDQYDSSALTIERRGNLKKDVDILGFKFHFPFKSGDVLLMARNPHLRKAGQVFFDGLCSDASYILRTKNPEVLLQDYIPILLQRDHFWDFFESHKTGGITFLMNWGMLKTYEFDLPPIEKQREVMEKVWAAYRLKQSYQKLIEATDEMVKSRFIAWSTEWKKHMTIRDLVDKSVEKAGKRFKPEDTIRYIDISSVDGESNSVTGTTEYIFSEAPSRAQQCTRKGDILVSTVRPNLKNIAVNQLDGDDLVASSGFCVLRPKEKCSGLILAYVLSEPFTKKMVAEAKGSNYPAIHDSDILDYPITVPKSHELPCIGAFVHQADKSKFELKQAIEKIDKVMRALMQ